MSTPLILPQRHSVLIRGTWFAIALLLAADAAWLLLSGVRFPLGTLGLIVGASLFLAVISFIYRSVRRDDAIWLGSQIVNQLVLGSCALGTFSYLALRLRFPLRDAWFIALDQGLGFDWLAYIGWVEHHPRIARILTVCYDATGPEILVILALLCFFRKFAQFHRFAIGYLLGGLVTVLIAAFLPALTAYVYRGIGPEAYPHLQVAAASLYSKEFFAMRDYAMQALPEQLQGIVAFPSFHSALAVLAIYAALALPFVLRWGFIIVNVLMLVSTPVDGGHYLMDTLAGIVVGLLLIGWTARLLPEQDAQATGA